MIQTELRRIKVKITGNRLGLSPVALSSSKGRRWMFSCFKLLAKDGGKAGFVQPFFRDGDHGIVELCISDA